MAPVLFLNIASLPKIPSSVWVLIAVSGVFQAIYMWGLAGAYKHGAISVAYPLLRTTPILFIALITSALDQGEALSILGITGILIIIVGCLLIPIKTFRNTQASTFLNLSCYFALISALGTIGYTIIDDKALSVLRGALQLEISTPEISLFYLLLETASCSLWLAALVMSSKNERNEFKLTINKHLAKATLTGISMALTYFLVLTSMAFVDNVSYVVAFRQLSIPIAVFLGVYLLKEHKSIFKFAGTLAIFTGIVLISLG